VHVFVVVLQVSVVHELLSLQSAFATQHPGIAVLLHVPVVTSHVSTVHAF
jgi:hypothetical protein